MSIFSNLASSAASESTAYIEAVIDLVGEREVAEVLEETPRAVREMIAGLSPGEMRTAEKQGKWSVNQVVQHLADSELVWGYRLRRVLAEDGPRLEGFDQDLWAEGLSYEDSDPQAALATFEAIRGANLTLLGRTDAAGLQRYAVHDERGRETLEHMMKLYAGHDLLHRNQIERIIRAVSR